MHAFKQRPAHLLKSNNASIFAHHARSPSLTGIKSRSGSITMDNAAEDLTSFRGHISGDLPILEGVSAGMANESYSLLLKRQQEVASPTSSGGQLSPHSENHHLRQTSLGKDVWGRSKSTEHEPKIIITPVVTDRFDQSELNSFSARRSLIRTSPFSPKKPSVGKKLSIFLKRKFTGDMSETSSIDSSKHQVEDPLTRKHTATFNRPSRSESGRLLSIIAKQAVIGRNHEISKVFHVALEKSNTEALRKAKKHLHVDRRKRIIRFCKNVKNRVMRIADPWKPDSLFVILWKVWMLAMILMHCFCSTYIVSFVPEDGQNVRNWIFLLDFVGDIFFLLEILSLFQIGYYDQGELHCERSDIVYHYLTTKFPIDVLTLVSIIGRVLSDTDWQYLILFTLIRTYKIKPLFAAIEDYLQLSREATSVVRVAKLSGLMIVSAHFCACMLYVLTLLESDHDNWIRDSGLEGKSQREIYVTSLYWSVTTMTTVGFGDIAPKTMVERIFVVGVMIVSSIIFGYILSTIGTLLLEVGASRAEAKEKIRILTKYMNDKGLHKDIQSKIRKYLEFYLDRENTAKIEGDFIMKMLSPNLQEELVREVNAKTIYDCYIFSSNFRRRFLYLVSKDLIERSYGPDESIYLRKDFTDCSAYFITSGRVDICYERCGISLQKMKKGACFGYMSFFSGKPRDSSAKSLEFTTVFQLMRERFIEKLEGFTTEKETYFMIRDSLVLYNTNQYINLKCYSCGSLDHTVAHCPSLHFTLDPQEVIKEYLAEEQKFRSDFIRRPRRKFHVLSNLEIVQECASQIQMGHQTEVENEVVEDEEFAVGGGSYSSIDEIFDRKVYDPKPLDYVADTTHMKFLDFPEGFKYTSVQTLNQIPGSKRMRQKVGEIETFMKNNYDMYHHNLNIDRVKNFEVYYPMNNITKLMVELEKVRLEKIVQMRLGFKAKHLGPLLVKSFKMYEKRQSSNLPSSTPLTKLPSLKPKVIKRHSVNITVRRESVAANPADIALYNSSETQSSFSRFRHKSILGTSSQLTPPYLLGTTELKKKFDPIEFSQKVGRHREKDLSTIREDYTEKNEKGSQSNLSIGTPKATPSGFKHFDFRFQGDSLLSKIEFKAVDTSTELKTPGKDILKLETKSFLFSPARTDTNNITKQYSNPPYMVGSDLSDISLEAEPSAGTSEIVDYSKLMQRFPNKTGKTEHRGRPDFIKHKSAQPEQSIAISGINNANMSIPDLMKTETETKKMFKALLQDRLFETDGNHRRSASEEKGKEILKVIDKYKLPRVFNKMTSNNDEEEDQTSGMSLKMYNM